MKNAFYFILKSLFVLKIFKFLSWLFGHVKKMLICFPGVDLIKLQTNPIFSIKPFFYMTKKNKNSIISRTKRTSKVK